MTGAFDRMDSSGKGYISKEDVRSLLGSSYTKEKLANFFNDVDLDKEGMIVYKEFIWKFWD